VRRTWFVGALSLGALAGCSFLYDLQTTQCETTSDCEAFGPTFRDTECVNRVCVPKGGSGASGGSSGQAGKGGSGGSGGSSGSSGAAGDGQEGGTGATGGTGVGGSAGKGGGAGSGGSAGKGGSGGSGGSGGEPTEPECFTNGECIDAHVDQPHLCKLFDPEDPELGGTCLALTNDNCPVVLPTRTHLTLMRDRDPILLGAFASMTNVQDPADTVAVINWDLAFDEFNTETLDGFDIDGDSRPVLAVVCKSATDVEDNMSHLAATLHVPAVLSTMGADGLLDAYNFTKTPAYEDVAENRPVFFMSTGSADRRLADLSDNGLVWHMLGNPRVLARTMVGALAMVEPVVNARRELAGEDPAEVPLRVTLVYSDDPTMTDIANVLTTENPNDASTMLFFNGQAAIDQFGAGDPDFGEFRRVQIESARQHTDPNVANGIEEIFTHPPHVVVAMGTAEFASSVIPSIEAEWGTGASAGLQRPHYLLSHLIYNLPNLQTVAAQYSSATPPLHTRIVGVNYAIAQDAHSQSLYNAYLSRLRDSTDTTLQLAGTENYYDGAYTLLYSLAAAYGIRNPPSGLDIVNGLDRVISTDSAATAVDIGPTSLSTPELSSNVSSLLNSVGFKMALWGTMGPPNFDRATGTRETPTSAWCIEPVDSTWTYRADGLLYDPATNSFSQPGTVPDCLAPYVPAAAK
jgi:hypothetical protein